MGRYSTDKNKHKPHSFTLIGKKYEGLYNRIRKPVKIGDVVYPSIRAAADAMGCSPVNISRHMKNKTPYKGMMIERG